MTDLRQTVPVSVVIPAYNAAETLAESIASVRAQTCRPCEIIVVDDASTDATRERLAALSGPDLVVLSETRNRGGAAARNRGILAARGDHIAFLDADDLWRADKLERQWTRARAWGMDHPGRPFFVFGPVVQTNEFGERHILPKRMPRPGESVLDFMLLHDCIVQTSTLFVPAAFARQVGFDPALRRHQDIDFVARMEALGACALWETEPLVEWRARIGAEGARVSRGRDPAPSRQFLDLYRARLTPAQARSFAAKNIAPRLMDRSPLAAISIVSDALVHGAVTPRWTALWLARACLGEAAYGRLRKLRP